MKKRLSFLFIIIYINATLSASASIFTAPAEQAQLAAQTKLLTKIATEETIRNNIWTVEYLPKVMQVIKGINAAAGFARTSVRMVKAVQERTWKDWFNDVMAGMEDAFPGMSELRREVEDLGGNIESVKGAVKEKNFGKFYKYKNRWDRKTLRAVGKFTEYEMKHRLAPWAFPLTAKYNEWEKRPHKHLVNKALLDSGFKREMEENAIRKRMFSKYIKQWRDEFSTTKDQQQRTEQMAIQGMTHEEITRIRQMQEHDFAEKQQNREEKKEHKAYQQHQYKKYREKMRQMDEKERREKGIMKLGF